MKRLQGTILFNFGFVTTIPSWVNEKRPDVSVNKVVWYSSFACVAIFFLIGIPGALAFGPYLAGQATNKCKAMELDPDFNCAGDIMAIMLNPTVVVNGTSIELVPGLISHAWSRFAMKLSVYMFPIVATVSSIPVFSIVIKYNCLENGWSKPLSNAWCNGFDINFARFPSLASANLATAVPGRVVYGTLPVASC